MNASGWIKKQVMRLQRWQETLRGRRELRQLSEEMLKDIGLSRVDAERIAARPFWDERPTEDATLKRHQVTGQVVCRHVRCASRV